MYLKKYENQNNKKKKYNKYYKKLDKGTKTYSRI